MANILEVRLQETLLAIDQLRETLKKQTDRLYMAEDTLRFYANPKTYKVGQSNYKGDVVQNVFSGTEDLEEAKNVKTVLIAGRRARLYFKEHGTD